MLLHVYNMKAPASCISTNTVVEVFLKNHTMYSQYITTNLIHLSVRIACIYHPYYIPSFPGPLGKPAQRESYLEPTSPARSLPSKLVAHFVTEAAVINSRVYECACIYKQKKLRKS